MTLGEIKLEALYLSFPCPEVAVDCSDREAMSERLSILREDPSYSDFLRASVGSVNRALAAFERKGLTPIISRTVSASVDASMGLQIIDLSAFRSELLSVRSVYEVKGGAFLPVSFEQLEDSKLLIRGSSEARAFTVSYRTRLRRIDTVTADDSELDICDSLACLIPYFIKGELLSLDDSEGADRAMSLFNEGCHISSREQYAEHGAVVSVYRQEEML